MSMPDIFEDFEESQFEGQISAPWTNVKSAFAGDGKGLRGARHYKTVATTANTVGSMGVSVASLATGTNSLAVAGAVIAGAAVSATGVGLVVVGGALTLASMGTNFASMAKSADTVRDLKKIRSNLAKYSGCKIQDPGSMSLDMMCDHDWIAKKVLPYIISQKTEKAVKKGTAVLPGVSILTNAYRLGRYAFKKDRGKKRGFYAYVLTRHLITHDCALAGAIVAELFSNAEMQVLRGFDSDESSPVIAQKMKSV
jgi:hypothetical protein